MIWPWIVAAVGLLGEAILLRFIVRESNLEHARQESTTTVDSE